MKYSAITIQGNIFSSDILEAIRQENIRYQNAADFNLDKNTPVREEIGIAWAAARAHWQAFNLRRERLNDSDSGTSQTRQGWMIPFLRELGYELEKSTAEVINGKSYAISHRAANRSRFPVHIVGFNQSLDKRAEAGGTRLSPHALAQEYLNNHEHLYALVSNGKYLRLLRDATRLSRLSFLEFNLERMMDEELYAEFALLFRALHVTRMPEQQGAGEESVIEFYHQESLAAGSRIRERLSGAVEESLKLLANGFLKYSANTELRLKTAEDQLKAERYYLYLLRLIYRMLFLMVIEDRHLIYPEGIDKETSRKRDLYYRYYSIGRLCRLAEKRIYVDARKTDLWRSLLSTFSLFEKEYYGKNLGISPLGSGLFDPDALGVLVDQELDNETLLKVLFRLISFEDENKQRVHVNYADLDVEEFGSVYEGLLEYDAVFKEINAQTVFTFVKGEGRSSSGSHYTPEELVKPLIQHSLEYLITDKMRDSEIASRKIASSEIVNSQLTNSEIDNWVFSESDIQFLLGGADGRNSILPGPGSLEKKYGTDRGNLSADQSIPKGRNVRNDQSNAPLSSVRAGELRRRLGPQLFERIHTFSQHIPGQSEGTGNTSHSGRAGRTTAAGSAQTINEPGGRNWQDAARAYIQSQKPLEILSLLPESTRYSLLANRSLLTLKVCDVAAGSGHILLSAARRIGLELARVRSGEDQPSPPVMRQATRDAINNCIYGVDKNPLAVELCKVALWLEAHNPGEPLNFLDHRIKCGDAIVGLAHAAELQKGIANEAFKTLPGDDKVIAAEFRKRNKQERKEKGQIALEFEREVNQPMHSIAQLFDEFNKMPEHSPQEIEAKNKQYRKLVSDKNYWRVKTLADVQTAQFFIPKNEDNKDKLISDAQYRKYLAGQHPTGPAVGKALAVAEEKRFFHWFLEFPEVFSPRMQGKHPESDLSGEGSQGGFDCILGNPPFLGGQRLSGTFGHDYLQWLKMAYAPAGSVDLVTYFFRRIYTLLTKGGFQSLIATNTIAQGSAREGGLDVIRDTGGSINHAVRSMSWPGLAAVEVALVTINKGKWNRKFLLDRKDVNTISSYLDDAEITSDPYPLMMNKNKSFQGSIVLGKGFVLKPEEAQKFIDRDSNNEDVILPYLNGDDLNSRPDQSPSRLVINFFDWPLDEMQDLEDAEIKDSDPKGPPYASDYPDCLKVVEKLVKPVRLKVNREIRKKYWWQFAEKSPKLYRTIADLDRVLVAVRISKYVNFVFADKKIVFNDKCIVSSFDTWEIFALLQSSINDQWAWKNATTLGGSTIVYTPNTCLETYPFPANIHQELVITGEKFYKLRSQLMLKIQLGLTKTYNQFHNQKLSEMVSGGEAGSEIANSDVANSGIVKKLDKQSAFLFKHLQKTEGTIPFNQAVRDIKKLRALHVEMDNAVLKAYGWDHPADEEKRQMTNEKRKNDPDRFYPPLYDSAIDLRHDFYEVDYLPENDRVRFTIHPEARKEVLKRLLELNHAMHEWEVQQGMWDKKKKNKTKDKRKKKKDSGQGELF